jgi:hypothetical protein
MRRDVNVRTNSLRKFMTNNVAIARDAIYRLGAGIRSKVIEDLLKNFSGVPTLVSKVFV